MLRKILINWIKRCFFVFSLFLEYYSDKNSIKNIFDYHDVMRYRRDFYFNGAYKSFGKVYNFAPANSYSIRSYSGIKGNTYCSFEHGMYFRNFNYDEEEYTANDFPVILVPSDERVEVVRKHLNKCVIAIGPDIHYANPVLGDYELKAIKKILGRTLLIFPAHNTMEKKQHHLNRKEFIDYVESIKDEHKYDTVLVCLYHVDIARGEDYFYLQKGWRVVTAGYSFSYDFKAVLKTIILLSDYVINQEFSSNVGWSIFLGKPVTIYSQGEYEIEKEGVVYYSNKSYGAVYDDYLSTVLQDYNESLTKNKYDYFAYHYGFNRIKTPEEMRLIIEFSKQVYKKKMGVKGIKKLANNRKYKSIREYILSGIK